MIRCSIILRAYLGGMLQLLEPVTHSLTCSAPESIVNLYNIQIQMSVCVHLHVGMGHRKGPEEATQPLDVSALLEGLTHSGHLTTVISSTK